VRRYDLAGLAAERGILAAEAADDPVLTAAALWNLATVLLVDRRSDLAEELAIAAARAIAPLTETSSQAAAMSGALHLVAASAAVREGKRSIARDHVWKHAEPVARKTGENNLLWTQFGPLNVQVIAVGVEAEAGNFDEAIRLAENVDTNRLTSVERRATHLLEVAHCYQQLGQDAAVLYYLIRAERETPDDLRYHPLSTSLLRTLLVRVRPTLRADVQALAQRAGIYAFSS
jgi:hypothetical protein